MSDSKDREAPDGKSLYVSTPARWMLLGEFHDGREFARPVLGSTEAEAAVYAQRLLGAGLGEEIKSATLWRGVLTWRTAEQGGAGRFPANAKELAEALADNW